jgi:hypothetical protein
MKREQYVNKMLCISVTFQLILFIMQKLMPSRGRYFPELQRLS